MVFLADGKLAGEQSNRRASRRREAGMKAYDLIELAARNLRESVCAIR